MAKTEETRYVCDVCGKEEKWKESIVEHMKGHVSIKIISSEFKKHEKPPFKYPEIRDKVKKAQKTGMYLWQAQKIVAEEIGISMGTLNTKYYQRNDVSVGEGVA